MDVVNLSSFEESLGRGERGYDDGVSSSAASKSSSSFAESIERDEGLVNNATNVNTNKVLQSGLLNYVNSGVIVEGVEE